MEYLGKRKTEWIETEEILSFFSKEVPSLSYESFVLQRDTFEIIQKLTIEVLDEV